MKFWDTREIPYGVRMLTWVTAIRWVGWGFAETLVPIFLYSFGHTFAEAGLLRSSYDIAFIISLPIIGMAVDRVRATTIILIGLLLYLFVGAGYLLAGVTGLAIFIVIGRLFNGVAYALDSVGRETYFRRHTPKEKIATVFGYFDTVSNFWWMVAAVAGIFLIKYFSIPVLLFLIAPAALIGFFIIWNYRKNETKKPIGHTLAPKDENKGILKEITSWSLTLKSLVMFDFFISFAYAVVMFFLPIEVYKEGASLSLVIIMGVVSTIPMLFGWKMGKWFDLKGSKVFTLGLILFSLLLLSLSFVSGYIWKLLVSFLVTLVIELLSVGTSELVTISSNPEHFGRVDGIMRSITNIGSLTGPIILGIAMDSYGIQSSYTVLAVIIFALAITFYLMSKNGFMKKAAKASI